MKKAFALLLSVALLTGCAAAPQKQNSEKLRVVTTLFPYYDFARAIAGDCAEVKLLLSPGREAHSFEPTPLDAVTVADADVFLYNGGEGEAWVDDLLDAAGENIDVIACMMDYVDAREEEFVEGMQGGEEEHDHGHDREDHDAHAHEEDHEERNGHGDSDEVEYDEHIWTSPRNAEKLCRAVCEALCEADGANEALYRANCESYCMELAALDDAFTALRAGAVRDMLVFADRFPLLYFCREYDLNYRAAFHGCSSDTEPSLATLKFLIDKVAHEEIPVVYTIDLDSKKIAEVVSECTGAEILTLYSLQTISREDFAAGETYISMMEHNLAALREGLM